MPTSGDLNTLTPQSDFRALEEYLAEMVLGLDPDVATSLLNGILPNFVVRHVKWQQPMHLTYRQDRITIFSKENVVYRLLIS